MSLILLKIEKSVQIPVDNKHRLLFLRNELIGGVKEIKSKHGYG